MMFDKGSKCNIISEDLVARLRLEPLTGKIVTKSFRHEEEINIGFVVVELLKENGTIARVRAYVVDSITEAQKVEIPEDIKEEFSKTGRWPKERYHGKIGLLLGVKDQNIQPQSLEIRDDLEIFKSTLSATTILGGRHERIFSTQMDLSHV